MKKIDLCLSNIASSPDWQESEEVKSNSLGIQLKKTEEELQIQQQETTDQLEVGRWGSEASKLSNIYPAWKCIEIPVKVCFKSVP